jgi:aryl sulfotransferase
MSQLKRYRSVVADSARWEGFRFRPGDIVISTPPKCGTTWMQRLVALLVFDDTHLYAPISRISPWLDMQLAPLEEVAALLDAQRHRRFIKTHTPLDGVPVDPRATYIVVARHPLDMAVSLYHQGDNLDRDRIRELTGQPEATRSQGPRPAAREWLLSWIRDDPDPREELDSLPGVCWHLSDAWSRRNRANVVLVHYDDLAAHLEDEMRRLAARLSIQVPEATWPQLVDNASFESMRSRAGRLLPGSRGTLKDPRAFFRRGTSGSGRELLSAEEYAGYRARVAELAPPELLAWLHRDEAPPQSLGLAEAGGA